MLRADGVPISMAVRVIHASFIAVISFASFYETNFPCSREHILKMNDAPIGKHFVAVWLAGPKKVESVDIVTGLANPIGCPIFPTVKKVDSAYLVGAPAATAALIKRRGNFNRAGP
jgi:hypothetical protein